MAKLFERMDWVDAVGTMLDGTELRDVTDLKITS